MQNYGPAVAQAKLEAHIAIVAVLPIHAHNRLQQELRIHTRTYIICFFAGIIQEFFNSLAQLWLSATVQCGAGIYTCKRLHRACSRSSLDFLLVASFR